MTYISVLFSNKVIAKDFLVHLEQHRHSSKHLLGDSFLEQYGGD